MSLSLPHRYTCNSRMVALGVVITAALFAAGGPSPAQAGDPAAPEPPALTTAEKQQIIMEILGPQESFTYQAEDRPDPFTPFLAAAVLNKPEEKMTEEDSEILTGMRQFEPGQLNLVAIVFGDAGPIAMVQDSVGKGYILKPGMRIGRHGEVDKIMPNAVHIKELSGTVGEEVLYKTVEMVLRKEGEK